MCFSANSVASCEVIGTPIDDGALVSRSLRCAKQFRSLQGTVNARTDGKAIPRMKTASLVSSFHRSDFLPERVVHIGAKTGHQVSHSRHLCFEHAVLFGTVFDVSGIDDQVGEHLRLILLNSGRGIVAEKSGELIGQD
jgi:hypothetical protein